MNIRVLNNVKLLDKYQMPNVDNLTGSVKELEDEAQTGTLFTS